MKLLKPAVIAADDLNTTMFIDTLRNNISKMASMLHCETEDVDFDVFTRYAYVTECYNITLLHVLKGHTDPDIVTYLNDCCRVFRGELEEVEFVELGLPEYVRAGLDELLAHFRAMLNEETPPSITLH